MDAKKNIIFELKAQNWGMKSPGSWDKTTWYVLDDYTVEEKVDYMPDFRSSIYAGSYEYEQYQCSLRQNPKESFNRKYSLSNDEITRFNQLIDIAKNNNDKVDGSDGTAWKFIYYKNNKVYWQRPLGYIYSIEVLEEITRLIKNG